MGKEGREQKLDIYVSLSDTANEQLLAFFGTFLKFHIAPTNLYHVFNKTI